MVRGWSPRPVSWDELGEGGQRRDSGFSTAVVLCSRRAWRWGLSCLKLRCPGHLSPPAGVVTWAFFSEHTPGPPGNKPHTWGDVAARPTGDAALFSWQPLASRHLRLLLRPDGCWNPGGLGGGVRRREGDEPPLP